MNESQKTDFRVKENSGEEILPSRPIGSRVPTTTSLPSMVA